MAIEQDVKNFHKLIGENVKRIREEKDFSQRELSLAIGQESTSIISQAELGKNKHFNIEQLYKISKELNVDFCEFFKDHQSATVQNNQRK
jgi:transcriptional regulator with XRE-family HTH domain